MAHPDATVVLRRAPTPGVAAKLSISALSAALRQGGRQRNIAARAAEIQAALRAAQMRAPSGVEAAYGAQVASPGAVIAEMTRQIAALEAELAQDFELHPDAEIVRSLPGLGTILGARVLGEFGDDANRYADGKARRNYAGTSPVTRASGKKRAVLARYVRNRHLADACYQWAFCALTRRRAPGRSTTSTGPRAKPTTRPCGSCRTVSSASSTAASATGPSTTNRKPGDIAAPPRPLRPAPRQA
ncbi:MAG: hypothetical protein QOJ52_1998 [Acidimicrobiaceae bacterium]|nr:hypothetical protein [Acidimicrobiaceae bacterium]